MSLQGALLSSEDLNITDILEWNKLDSQHHLVVQQPVWSLVLLSIPTVRDYLQRQAPYLMGKGVIACVCVCVCVSLQALIMAEAGLDLSRKFVSESEIEERKRKRQEEWEKVRKPEDPEEAPEEEYDPRSLYERLQEQKDKKQEEYEEQFKFKNMVRGLNEDETSFLDEVSRQQSLIEKQRRDEELKELKEYRISFPLLVHRSPLTANSESKKEPEKKAGPRVPEHRSLLSQAHLLAGAVKRRSSLHLSDGSKKQKQEDSEGGGGAAQPESVVVAGDSKQTPVVGMVLPSAAVCVGILPGLGAYSGSSDSESSSDSEGLHTLAWISYYEFSRRPQSCGQTHRDVFRSVGLSPLACPLPGPRLEVDGRRDRCSN
ncbi:protein FAM192A isoform X1 [Arapaima gigas]